MADAMKGEMEDTVAAAKEKAAEDAAEMAEAQKDISANATKVRVRV